MIADESLEYCESARFSMYIDCENHAYPCSFGWSQNEHCIDLNHHTILEAWNSLQFADFRSRQSTKCMSQNKSECRCCALDLGVKMCNQIIRK